MGGEYDFNEDSGLVIHIQVLLRLAEAVVDIHFGNGDDNNYDRHNHHHHSNWVSVVGRAAAASNASMWPRKQPCGKRGFSRPGPGGCRDGNENIGIGIGIRRKE